MAEYGKYSCTDSIIAIYKSGKLERIIDNVKPETVFVHEDYNREGFHYLDFDYTENETELKASVTIYPINSFRIFPSWMLERLNDIL